MHHCIGQVTHLPHWQMRLFGREDLELLEELDPESPVGESGESAVRYKARLRFGDRGLVTVRRFPRPDDKFHHEVEVGRDIWYVFFPPNCCTHAQ